MTELAVLASQEISTGPAPTRSAGQTTPMFSEYSLPRAFSGLAMPSSEFKSPFDRHQQALYCTECGGIIQLVRLRSKVVGTNAFLAQRIRQHSPLVLESGSDGLATWNALGDKQDGMKSVLVPIPYGGVRAALQQRFGSLLYAFDGKRPGRMLPRLQLVEFVDKDDTGFLYPVKASCFFNFFCVQTSFGRFFFNQQLHHLSISACGFFWLSSGSGA